MSPKRFLASQGYAVVDRECRENLDPDQLQELAGLMAQLDTDQHADVQLFEKAAATADAWASSKEVLPESVYQAAERLRMALMNVGAHKQIRAPDDVGAVDAVKTLLEALQS